MKSLAKPEIEQDIEVDNNFDFLRLVLAISVFCSHYDILMGTPLVNFPFSLPRTVSSFFVISGLLIFRSYCRSSSLKSYARKRLFRIFPAYLLVVLLSAFLFLPFSALQTCDYLSSSDLWKYLAANALTLNFLHPDLPGVLDGEAVNPSLWTIKIELLLYCLVPLLACFCVGRRRGVSIVLAVILSAIAVFLRWNADRTGVGAYDLVGKWTSLCACFMAGVAVFLYHKEMAKYKWYLCVPAVVAIVADGYVADFFHSFSLGVLIYVVAFSFPLLNKFGRCGDFSYGIYLFHAPIIRLTQCAGWNVSWGNFIIVLLVVLSSAFLSWRFFEKRFLSR